MTRWLLKLRCRLTGHIMDVQTFKARGRRVEITSCLRCGHVDPASSRITSNNRKIRRRAARTIARELAR